jgi:hypothetical protein
MHTSDRFAYMEPDGDKLLSSLYENCCSLACIIYDFRDRDLKGFKSVQIIKRDHSSLQRPNSLNIENTAI